MTRDVIFLDEKYRNGDIALLSKDYGKYSSFAFVIKSVKSKVEKIILSYCSVC